MKIVPELTLNGKVGNAKPASLAFAKNVKAELDGSIVSDYGYEEIEALADYNIVGHIVGLDNKIYFLTSNEKTVQISSINKEITIPGADQNTYTSKLFLDGRIQDGRRINSTGRVYYFDITPIRNADGTSVNNVPEEYLLETIADGLISGGSEADYTNMNNRYFVKLEYAPNATDEEIEASNYLYKTREQCINKLLNYIEEVLTIATYNDGGTEKHIHITGENRLVDSGTTLGSSGITHSMLSDYPLSISNYVIYQTYLDAVPTWTTVREKLQQVATYKNLELDEYIVPDNTTIIETIPRYRTVSTILEYDEITRTAKEIECAWHHSGGSITGAVTTNTTGEKILTIAENLYNKDSSEDITIQRSTDLNNLVPIKHINLSYCSYEEDESIYTQCPKVPIANVTLVDTYANTIPNGTYVFFIRYEIRKNVFTPWYHCSRPMFAGVSENIDTIQGSLKYINTHKDSAKSFILNVSYLLSENKELYKKFQLGFIITNDDSTNARAWKCFDINTNIIYFDYNCVTEVNIEDLKNVNYELYNVDNVTTFKNNLYISNYTETNFNDEDLKNITSKIKLGVVDERTGAVQGDVTFNGRKLLLKNGESDIYDRTADGVSLCTLLNKDTVSFSVTKGSTVEKKSCAAYDITVSWNASVNPDIVAIKRVTPKIRGYRLLGSFNGDNSWGRDGVYMVDKSDSGWWHYDNTGEHPFYNLGLTLGYGSVNDSDLGTFPQGYCPFNKNSKVYDASKKGRQLWLCLDAGFKRNGALTPLNNIKNNIKSEIDNFNRIAKLYCIFSETGSNKVYKAGYLADYDAEDFIKEQYPYITGDANIAASTVQDDIINTALVYLQQYLYGIRLVSGGINFVFKFDNNTYEVNNIQVLYRHYNFTTNIDGIDTQETSVSGNATVTLTPVDIPFNCGMSIKSGIISTTVDEAAAKVAQSFTLMPFSTYKAYAHFVDEHGIISNGFLIDIIKTPGVTYDTSLLKLTYTIDDENVNFKHYKAFFISLVNVGDKIVELFGQADNDEEHGGLAHDSLYYAYALEADTLAYALNNNLILLNANGEIVSKEGSYYGSANSDPKAAFGNVGFVAVPNTITNIKYIKIPSDVSGEEGLQLIKATDYIPLIGSEKDSNNNNALIPVTIENGFYGGYLCSVKKPSYPKSARIYVNGRDVLKKNENTLVLTDLDDNTILSNTSTPNYFIRSNFNLNYLTLTQTISDQIFTVSGGSGSTKYVIKMIDSPMLSYIYALSGMYKDYDNVYYVEANDLYNIKFDNTIRVSNVLADEDFNNSVFTFAPTEYYNIPTDRGVIVKLFAIANAIYAHTKQSLYKFDANQTIMSSEDDIQLKESDPFDTGISQVLDSQYGYGGINNKEAGCITFNSYFFYDKETNHIFTYGGNSQLNVIDNAIYEILKYYKPEICRTIHDDLNHRVLFEFVVPENKKDPRQLETNSIGFTISYNYLINSFVSLHDLTLLNSFNSRGNCYSYRKNLLSLFDNFESIDARLLDDNKKAWNIYGDATCPCWINIQHTNHIQAESPFSISVIMFPKESIRECIDSIKYIINENIKNFNKITGGHRPNIYVITDTLRYQKSNDIDDIFDGGEVFNPVSSLYIKTDICESSDVNTTIDDIKRPNPLSDYKGFKYDNGVWSANYFRNILHADNIYQYDHNNLQPIRDLNSDNNSLVYGKYFIITFNFTTEFPCRFEDISINSKPY